MSLSVRLSAIKCIEEINESSASEEPYVIVTAVQLRPTLPGQPTIQNVRVKRYGVWEDFDAGETTVVNDPPFWGLDGTPEDIRDPGEVRFMVSLLENDNASPDQYRVLVESVASASLAATLAEPDREARFARLLASIRDALNGIDLPIPFALDDDHIGTEALRLDAEDLIPAGAKQKTLRIRSGEGDYELRFEVARTSTDWSGLDNDWRNIGGIFPPRAPVVALANAANHLDLFITGNDGRVYTSWWRAGQDWSGLGDRWRSVGGIFPPGAPVTAVSRSDQLDLFITGNDGRVYTSWWREGQDWSGIHDNWRPLGGFFPPGAPVAAVARLPDHLDLFITGNDGRVYTSWWYAGTDWSGIHDNWRPIGGFFPRGAPIAVVSRLPDHLDLFITGNDGRVYTSWWKQGVDWSGVNNNWMSVGGFFPAGAPVSALARFPNHLDLFTTGNDGRVYTSWWQDPNWSGTNNNWRNIGGIFPKGAHVNAIAREPNQMDLFITGNDGRVYTSWWHAGGDWSGLNDNWRPIGGFFPAGGVPAVAARTPNNLDVFITGNDGRVYTSWWPAG